MGAETYTWVTKYKKNLADALAAARMEAFASGKFIGAEEHPSSIEMAMEIDPESGTGSLLDIASVSEAPELCSVCQVSKKKCVEFFGTERPTFAEIEKCMPFWESFDRGEARAVTLYENGKPALICFAGWTIDAPSAGSGGTFIEKTDEVEIIPNEEDSGWPTWDLTKQVRVIYLVIADMLSEPASDLVCKAQKRFKSWGLYATMNHGHDLVFGFPESWAVDTRSSKKVNVSDEMSDFLHVAWRQDHIGFLDGRYVNFPNGRNRIMLVTSMAESDLYNQLMLQVSHTNTIALNRPMTVTLKFHPRTWYLEEGEVPDFLPSIEKSDKIICEWFHEAQMVGFNREFVYNENFYIERLPNGCKFQITCKEPIEFPFWELYLRLRSGLSPEERFSTLSFSGSRIKKSKGKKPPPCLRK